MKKALFFVALATVLLQAVNLHAQVGFHAGYAPQTMSITSETVDTDPTNIRFHGVFGGIHYDFNIVNNLDFIAALQIRLNWATAVKEATTTQDWQFLADVPLLVDYSFELGKGLAMGAFAGPVVSYGISYTQKTTDNETIEVISSVNPYDNSIFKRFEVAAMGGLFFEYKGVVLFGGYRYGLNDLDRVNDCTTRARGFFVGIGFD